MNPSAAIIPVLNKLRSVRRSGSQFVALCPVPSHGDRVRSLSIGEGREGVVLKCFAGCSVEDICAAIKLEVSDLFPDHQPNPSNTPYRTSPPTPSPITKETRYAVCDLDGHIVAEHVRYDRANGKKAFAWRRPGKGSLDGMPVTELPLFGTQHLRTWKDGAIILCEGEKAALSLQERLIPAVGTVCGAASTPSGKVLASLDPYTVYLWPDNDDPGRAHMGRIGARLADRHGWPFVIHWREAPAHGDAYDYAQAHPDVDLPQLIDMAELWERESDRGEMDGDFRAVF